MAEVVLRNVVKVYAGDVEAVRDISFTAHDGEFLVLVGPSGCGKSTTLRLIAGLEEPTAGEIYIDGQLVNEVPPKDRDVAMVFQNYALYPHMTVYKNMSFGLRLRRYPKAEIEKRVRWAGKLLGIEHLLDRKPRALSGGERQRVAVGRAIVRQPKVFLFDEPLSNLDAKLRVETRAELKRLHQKLGITTIYVTHDQVEAMTLGERIAVMKDGRIHQIATPQEIYNHPSDMFVAGFVGTPPMNFIEGAVFHRDGQAVFKSADFELTLDFDAPEGEAVLGIRPENLKLDGQGEIPAEVSVVEPLGSEMLVYATTGSEEMVARIPLEAALKPGETVRFRAERERVHLFGSVDGRNLCFMAMESS